MTEKMLIVGGDSNSDQGHPAYVDGVFTWPQIVADELGMKLFNVAKGGMSNDFIENIVFDAVLHHRDMVECTVMILWTDPNRVNVDDKRALQLPLVILAHCGRARWCARGGRGTVL